MNWRVSKTDARRLGLRIFLAASLVMTFRTFQFFPGMPYVQEAWFVLCFLTVLLLYPFLKISAGMRFSWFELYLFLLMAAEVLIAVWQAHQVFGQPLLYGILAQRRMSLLAMVLMLLFALRSRIVEQADIEATLLFLAWGTLALYLAMRICLNPADFVGYGIGFVTQPMPGEAVNFKLQGYFITFAMLYYSILGMRTRRKVYYLAAAVLFLGSLGPTGRGYMVCLALTLLAFLYRIRGFRSATIATLKFGSIAAVLGGAFYAISPNAFSARLAGFADAFVVILTGSPTSGSTGAAVSANARIFETLRALPFILEHPFLGNGVISNQWQGGVGTLLGDFFHTEDIGVTGVVFSYGILGLLLYLFQYRFAWSAVKRLPGSAHTPLVDATKAFVLFTALYSIQTALFAWAPEITLFFIALLCRLAAQNSSVQPLDMRTGEQCALPRFV